MHLFSSASIAYRVPRLTSTCAESAESAYAPGHCSWRSCPFRSPGYVCFSVCSLLPQASRPAGCQKSWQVDAFSAGVHITIPRLICGRRWKSVLPRRWRLPITCRRLRSRGRRCVDGAREWKLWGYSICREVLGHWLGRSGCNAGAMWRIRLDGADRSEVPTVRFMVLRPWVG